MIIKIIQQIFNPNNPDKIDANSAYNADMTIIYIQTKSEHNHTHIHHTQEG